MKALVVYESMYGNTAAIAEAIARSLMVTGMEVELTPISRCSPERAADVDLLVAGGPTHAHGMSWPATRKAATQDAKNRFSDPTAEPGLRRWMNDLPPGMGRQAAAFDTRFDRSVAITGSAAKGLARRLEGHGYHVCTAPASFFVTQDNSLADGEAARAAAWGAALAERCAGRPDRSGV